MNKRLIKGNETSAITSEIWRYTFLTLFRSFLMVENEGNITLDIVPES